MTSVRLCVALHERCCVSSALQVDSRVVHNILGANDLS